MRFWGEGMRMKMRQSAWLTAVALGVLLAGCSKESATAQSQVLAKVNDDEITVTQLNTLLAQQSGAAQEGNRVKQEALDYLVDQDVLVRKAADLKLDQDPAVMAMIEFSRRQILAQAAAGRVLKTALTKPSEQDISSFYTQHPDWFAKRRVFDFIRFSMPRASVDQSFRRQLDASRSPDATRQLLAGAKVAFQQAPLQLSGERIPQAALAKIAALKAGDIMANQQGETLVLMQFVQSESAPIDERAAHDAIAQLLSKQRNEDALKTQMDTLKQAVKISYMQHFSDSSAPVAAKQAVTAGGGAIQSGLKGL